jgi:hypothetical protein
MAELQNTKINDTLDVKVITNEVPSFYREDSSSSTHKIYSMDIKLPESSTYTSPSSLSTRQPGVYIDIPTKYYNLAGQLQISTGYNSSDSAQAQGDMIFNLNEWYVKPTSGASYISPKLGTSTYPFSYLYLKYMPYVNGQQLLSKSGSITGSSGITFKFADGSQICYGYFTKSVEMDIAFGNIYYGTASNDLTFSTKFTTKPTMIVTIQDNDAISGTVMDQSGLTASSYTGRWLFNSPISTTKSVVVGWACFGLWK